MRYCIIGDCHGQTMPLRDVLVKAGVIFREGDRKDGWHVIQLGDLVHCGRDYERDVDILKACLKFGWIDEYLLGNHEYAVYVPGAPSFVGQGRSWQRDQLMSQINYKVAAKVNDWLITHAGLMPFWDARYVDHGWTADELNAHFDKKPLDPIFSYISYERGGNDPVGGILWNDWSQLRQHNHRQQIVGHTPQHFGPDWNGDIWNIDVGAGLLKRAACLVIDADGKVTTYTVGVNES